MCTNTRAHTIYKLKYTHHNKHLYVQLKRADITMENNKCSYATLMSITILRSIQVCATTAVYCSTQNKERQLQQQYTGVHSTRSARGYAFSLFRIHIIQTMITENLDKTERTRGLARLSTRLRDHQAVCSRLIFAIWQQLFYNCYLYRI